ncbi:TPM domain-containing protein [Providencia burhodogranariea]|uniref:TPM domain-containing protein n=1 Tax=Providencia burhodogranariea TaxID=516074 RepID=UPI001F3BD50E
MIDSSKLLTTQQFQRLNNLLIDFENNRRDGSQFVLYIVPTIGNETIEQFASRAFNQWKIGKEGKDNGILLVVSTNDHKVRFEIGYGYEGILTDVLSGRIIRNDILPSFKSGNYYSGIERGLKHAMQVANSEPIEFDNSLIDLIPFKILQTHFTLIYLAIFSLIYAYKLIFGTRRLKKKINNEIALSEKKKTSRKRGYKIGAKQLKRLKKYLQYKYYFPTSLNMFGPVTLYTLAAIFFTQVYLDGLINPFMLILMIMLSIFFNIILMMIIFSLLNLLLPLFRQQKKEWNEICSLSRVGSPFYQSSVASRSSYRYSSGSSSSSSSYNSGSSGSSSSSSSRSSSGGGGGSSGGGGASGSW